MVPLVDGVPFPIPPDLAPEPRAEPPPAPGGSSESFERFLSGVSSALDRGEALVSEAHRAAYAPMDPGTLIALQAGIYRYAEAVDLTAKIVDRATTAVRTVLQAGH